MTNNNYEKLDYETLKIKLNNDNVYWLDKMVAGGKVIDGEYRASNIHGGSGKSFSYDVSLNIFKDHVDASIGKGKHGIFGLYQQQHPEAKPHEIYAYFNGTPVDHKKAETMKAQVKAKKERVPTTYFSKDLDQEKLLADIERHNLQYSKKNELKFDSNYYYTRPDKTIAYVMSRYYDKDNNKQIRPISAIKATGKTVGLGVTPDKFIPYNLHDIIGNDKPILMVEGEKTCDFIKPIIKDKFAVTTFTYGAGTISKLDQQGLRHFKDRKVFLWPDKDEEGQGYEAFKLTAQTLKGFAESVALVDVSKISQLTFKDNDLADLVSNGKVKTFEDFFKILTGDLRTTKEEPRQVQVSEVQDATGEQLSTHNGSSADNRTLIDAIKNGNAIAANAMGKLNEAVVLDILESKLLPFKIYKDTFTDSEVVEYKHRSGEYKKTMLKTSEPMILTQLQRLGFKVQRQQVATALATYALESIELKDSLKEATLEYKQHYNPNYKPELFFSTYYGTPNDEYHTKLSLIFLQNMISCWLGDDLPNDFCIVLAGGQGHGKGRLGHILAGGNDFVGEMSGKDMDNERIQKTALNGSLAVQFSEFEKQGKGGVNALKRFISLESVKFNKKYSEEEGNLKIRAFKYITTNDTDIFTDNTGNRRFGVVHTIKPALAEKMIEERNMIIAGALHLYNENMAKGLTHNKLCMDESFVKLRDEYLLSFTDRHELYDSMINWFIGYDSDDTGDYYGVQRTDVPTIEFMKAMDKARGSSYPVTKKGEAIGLLKEIGCLRDNRNYTWNLPPSIRNKREYNAQV